MFDIFSFADDHTQHTMKIIGTIDPSINVSNIGQQIKMSANDIVALNRAYSCNGTVPTYGGGNFKVVYTVKNGLVVSVHATQSREKEVITFLFCTCKA